ncbi:MAG: MOSC domain-containing protein [Acidobacteriota bacterium]
MELAEVVGQLVALRRFPIEPLGGEAPDEVAVRPDGAVGDRVFGLVDERDGQPLTWKSAPELLLFSARFLEALVVEDLESWTRVRVPDGREFSLADPEWLAEASRRLGRPVRLRRVAPGSPGRGLLHLISRETLRFVERVYGSAVEPQRLRANFVIDLPGAKAFEEDEWVGRQIRIGDTLCEVEAPSQGCLATSYRPAAGPGDASMLDGLLKVRGGSLGLQVRATRGQRIRVADPVSLVD